MKKNVLIIFLFFISINNYAQKYEIVPPPPAREYPALNDSILNGKKWYVDLSEIENPKALTLFKNPHYESYFHFTDRKNVVLNVNEEDCKCTLNGTYDIQLNEIEDEFIRITLQNLDQTFVFQEDKNTPKCVKNLIWFLEFFDLNTDYYQNAERIIIRKSGPAVAPVM